MTVIGLRERVGDVADRSVDHRGKELAVIPLVTAFVGYSSTTVGRLSIAVGYIDRPDDSPPRKWQLSIAARHVSGAMSLVMLTHLWGHILA